MADPVFFALADQLCAQGFRAAVGRPRRGERTLIQELARRTKKSERQVRRLLRKRLPRQPPKRSAAHEDLVRRLRQALATKVDLTDKGGAGSIVIGWHGYDHLDSLLSKLGL